MKQHKGMRPQDIVVLLKISTLKNQKWYAKDLANALYISHSEISESLNRSSITGLLSQNKKWIMPSALLEFLEHGLKYVFPAIIGPVQRGIYTAHSMSPLNTMLHVDLPYVWPWAKGNERGQSVEPLYSSVPVACRNDKELYELLALTDAIRIGKVREQQLAVQELENRIF